MTTSFELTTAGARTAYLLHTFPAQFDDQEPTDFDDPAYENLHNCLSGVAAIFDRHVRQTSAPGHFLNCTDSAVVRQRRISAVDGVRVETIKDVECLELLSSSAVGTW